MPPEKDVKIAKKAPRETIQPTHVTTYDEKNVVVVQTDEIFQTSQKNKR